MEYEYEKRKREICRFLAIICLLFVLQACATTPIPKKLNLEHPPRLGIIGFKVTAPIKHLSSIISSPPSNLSRSEEALLIDERLHDIEKMASEFLVEDLKKDQTVEPVPIPGGLFGTHPGEQPTTAQMDQLRRELTVDAVLTERYLGMEGPS